jgi:poly(hydroxyalkanoate) depolymerase family esterase
MLDFGKTIGRMGKWEQLRGLVRGIGAPPAAIPTVLNEVRNPTPNPGNLRMFTYVPAELADAPALVVVLHGCGQTAAGYDHGAGWSTLADRYGFALLLPEQQRSNNPNGCFNWFVPGDTRRDSGEAASIRAMVDTMVREHGIDRHRVFVTGLSAGGAMTSVMLACYPEVFAAGAIIAGLPYGAAGNVQQAFQSMSQSPSRPAREWGDLVRHAAPAHSGRWPRVSIWHGNADKTVIPSNAREILKQWTAVHGLPASPSLQTMVDGYPRAVWLNDAGEEIIDSYSITHMAHGTPLATGDADSECGAAGPFLLEVGISSSFHIAKFFGLTGADVRTARPARKRSGPPVATQAPAGILADAARPEILDGEILDAEPKNGGAAPPPPRIDIGAVIAKALEAAGLMKP